MLKAVQAVAVACISTNSTPCLKAVAVAFASTHAITSFGTASLRRTARPRQSQHAAFAAALVSFCAYFSSCAARCAPVASAAALPITRSRTPPSTV